MKLFNNLSGIAVVSALVLGSMALPAQETNQIELLKRQLQQMQENFERVQREQRQQIEALTKKLDDLAEKKKLEQELAAELQKGAPGPPNNPSAPAPSVA